MDYEYLCFDNDHLVPFFAAKSGQQDIHDSSPVVYLEEFSTS